MTTNDSEVSKISHEVQKDNFLIKIQGDTNKVLIMATNYLNGSRYCASIDMKEGLNKILLDRINNNTFAIHCTESTLGISIEVYPITHTVNLLPEYSNFSNSDELKDVWSFINKLLIRIDQLEQKKPKTKRINIPLLTKIQPNSKSTHQIPIQVPQSTISLILRCECLFGNTTGHSYLEFEAQQQGNNDGILRVDKKHYNWYYNNTIEEFVIPWNGDDTQNQTLEIRVLSALSDGDYSGNRVNSSYYTLSIEGLMEY